LVTTDIAAWDRRFAAPMFYASSLSLVFLAGVLHLHEHVDDRYVFFGCLLGLGALYPLYWFEALVRWRQRSPQRWWTLLYCMLPPLRVAARDHATGQQVWLPELGWQPVDRALRSRIEAALNTPILVVSLAVLPLILVEYVWKETITSDPFWARWIAIATAVIWLAFAGEFILMASIAEKKLAYCKQHWLDLVIILLPLVAFLRALRLGRLLRLSTLTNSSRVYRLRGVAMRAYRALLVIKAIDNLVNGSPARRLARLRQRLEEHEALLEQLRAEIRALEADHEIASARASAA
jgi:voltage-gated potassium channel